MVENEVLIIIKNISIIFDNKVKFDNIKLT